MKPETDDEIATLISRKKVFNSRILWIFMEKTFLIKNQSYQDEIFKWKPTLLQDITFPPCKQTEKRRKVNEKRFQKRLPSLLKLNAFRVLSYLFDYLQFCASLLLNISLPSTLIFLGDAHDVKRCSFENFWGYNHENSRKVWLIFWNF